MFVICVSIAASSFQTGCSQPEDDWDRLAEREQRIEEETKMLLDEYYRLGILLYESDDITENCWSLGLLLSETITELEASLDADSGLQMRDRMLDGKPQNYRELDYWAESIESWESYIAAASNFMDESIRVGGKERCF